MVSRRLRPGYDYLVYRKLCSLWHELTDSCLQPDLDQFIAAAQELGFSERVASAIGSQIIARLLIQTGRPLTDLRESDLQELLHACDVRYKRTGRGAKHYHSTSHSARQILFHLGILEKQTPPAVTALSLEQRMADVPAALRPAFVAYLNRKHATCVPQDRQHPGHQIGAFRQIPRRCRSHLDFLISVGPTPPHRTVHHLADHHRQQRPPVRRSPLQTGSDASMQSGTSSPRSPNGDGTMHHRGG